MKRYKGAIALLLVFAIFTGSLFWMTRTDAQRGNQPKLVLSVIMYGENPARWQALDLGIRQACSELKIEKPVISITGGYLAEEQKSMIKREINNQVDGVLVAPCNSREMQTFLEPLAKQIPIVLIENTAGEILPCVRADDEQMGRELAARLADRNHRLVVLDTGEAWESTTRRREAFLQSLDEAGVPYSVWSCLGRPAGYIRRVEECIEQMKPDVLVAFDNESLEAAGRAAADTPLLSVYGVGCSEEVVYGLDNGSIEEVCFQNEFSIGYIATMQLAQQLGIAGARPKGLVEFKMVNRQTMYEPENERLVFPIIQ